MYKMKSIYEIADEYVSCQIRNLEYEIIEKCNFFSGQYNIINETPMNKKLIEHRLPENFAKSPYLMETFRSALHKAGYEIVSEELNGNYYLNKSYPFVYIAIPVLYSHIRSDYGEA